MLSVFFAVSAQDVLCEHSVELAVHSAGKFSVSREADPYDTLVIGIALSDDIPLFNKPVDRNRKSARGNAQVLCSLCHCSGFFFALQLQVPRKMRFKYFTLTDHLPQI